MNLLTALESEAIFILREVLGQCTRPVLLFSGGKESMVLLHLLRKAAWPGAIPLPLLHIDTGHNFPEVLNFRDQMADRYQVKLHLRSVEDSLRMRLTEESADGSRNVSQRVTLADAIQEMQFDAVLGGTRRDEEKTCAKERVFSLRQALSRGQPAHQRLEVGHLYNGTVAAGEHLGVFPLSNWTEIDIWRYIVQERIELPSLYFAHARSCVDLHGQWIAANPFLRTLQGLPTEIHEVRFRTVGDMACSVAVLSSARDAEAVLQELLQSSTSERIFRFGDLISENSMDEDYL